MFDAPDEVMSYLCHQYKVHDVPVGTEQTKAMITQVCSSSSLMPAFRFQGRITRLMNVSSSSQVIEELNLRVLYTTDERYTLKRSVYSKMISTSNSAVNPSQYLSITVDAEEKRQLEQQLKVRKPSCVTPI